MWLTRVVLCGALAASFGLHAAELDKREFSMRCAEQDKPRAIACDYRHGPSFVMKQLTGAINGNEIQLDPKWVAPFPAPGDSSAILILVDISDSRRAATLENKVKPLLDKLLDNVGPHQKFGLAVFDSDVKVLAPVVSGSEAARAALKDVRAEGLATEFYKSILKGIELLGKTDAQRRILVIVSDGKAEDTAYTRTDVLTGAKGADVSLLSLGYAERPSDAAYLQTLERLSAETHGRYLNAQKTQLSDVRHAIGLLERGGRVTIPADEIFGLTRIQLVFGRDRGEPITLSQEIRLADQRSWGVRLESSFRTHWYFWLAGTALLISFVYGLQRLVRSQKNRRYLSAPFGALVELDSKGTRYILKGSAVRLGRGRNNDLVFANDTVSSIHAEILRRRDGSVHVNDLGSSNGLFVNSERVTETQLRSGDILEIGEVRLRFEAIGRGA